MKNLIGQHLYFIFHIVMLLYILYQNSFRKDVTQEESTKNEYEVQDVVAVDNEMREPKLSDIIREAKRSGDFRVAVAAADKWLALEK